MNSLSEPTLTLEPLRRAGPEALLPDEDQGIMRIKLRAWEHASLEANREVTTKRADDLFANAPAEAWSREAFPAGGELRRATLAFFFGDSPVPRTVEIAPPAILAFETPADASRVLRFLIKRGFVTSYQARADR